MRWVKASNYVKLSEESQNIAKKVGLFPINDELYPFMEDDSKIIIIRGGRGGGKSNTIALRLIEECRTEDYFKCYYGRKVLDRVRGSQHQELVKAIKQLNLEDEFDFSENPHGSLTIQHKATKNAFFAFGADNSTSLKSISDPTHIWGEEFDQFDEKDFTSLYPTLRTKRGKNIFIASFNSYEVQKDHWILKLFFPNIYNGKEKYDYDILDGIEISHYLINFTDNYFIDQEEYEQKLRLSAGGDADLFSGLARGDWGVNKVGNRYYHSFKKGIHVTNVERLSNLPDHLGFDFNLVPYMTLLCIQFNETDNEYQVRVFKEYCLSHPRNTTEGVAYAYLNEHEPLGIRDIFYYGDAMGTRGIEGFGDEFTRFEPVRKVLFKYITDVSDRTTRYNVGVQKRQLLVNKILSGLIYVGIKKVRLMVDESCIELIKDMELLQEGVNGKHKEKAKDEMKRSYEKYGHTSDTLEYVLCEIFESYLD